MRKHKIAVALVCVVFFTGAAPPVRPGDPISAEDQAQIAAIPIERIAPADYFPEWYQLGHKIPAAFSPNDEYFPYNSPPGFAGQWNLENQTPGGGPDANLRGAWDRNLTGAGVIIGIVDDALQWYHPDLTANFVQEDSWDFRDNLPQPPPWDPRPLYTDEIHGTAVAGVAAARGGNEIGVTGAAPQAGLAGLRIWYAGGTDEMFAEATTYHSSGENTNIKIKNHSYYYPAPYIDSTTEVTALGTSAAAGTLHTFAAGNDRASHGYWDSQKNHAIDGDANKKDLQSAPESITVAALAEDGRFAYYSNWGANVFVTAPSSGTAGFGVTTTDLLGVYGYNGFPPGAQDYLDYTPTFGGTSAAAPLVAGIIALGKQVYAEMDVRAAKHLLARTAVMVDPGDADPMGGWITNAGGFHFNNNYGFGLIDADAFTGLAALVQGLTEPAAQDTGADPVQVGADFGGPGTPTELARTFVFNTPGALEDVKVYLNIGHDFRGQVEGYLTSPGGTTSRLMTRNASDLYDDIVWTFVSNAFWGEDALGTWELRVIDTYPASDDGTWNSYKVTANMGYLDVSSQWALEGGGSYNVSANWTDYRVPNGVDAVANFLGSITTASTVTVDAPVTVGTINFDNANSYTIGGTASITFETSTGDAEINVAEGDHAISARLSFAGGLTVDTANATTLTIAPAAGYSLLEGDLTKNGAGSLMLASRLLVVGQLNLNAGEVTAAANALALEGGNVNLADGTTLRASGSVPRLISLASGADPYNTKIVATGPLTVGNAQSAGYDFEGTLEVGEHAVTVVGPAGTAPVITFATLDGGTLSGSPELRLAPAVGVIYGTGKVTGTVELGEGGVEAALVSGIDDANRLEFSGLVRGNAPAAYVDFTGYGPTGWSPAYIILGQGNNISVTVFEIGGNAPGKLIYDPTTDVDTGMAGDYTQFHVVGDATGPGSPTTFMSLLLKEYAGFEWSELQPGDLDLIFAAPARIKIGMPLKSTDCQPGTIAYGASFLADLDRQLAAIRPNLAPGLDLVVSQMDKQALTLTVVRQPAMVVPEPGTLVLLLTGGLGLVLLVWRRRRTTAGP